MGKEKLNLNTIELVEFFNKYDIYELEVLNGILSYALDYNTEAELDILEKTHNKKVFDCYREFSIPIGKEERISEKIDCLNEEELKFLHDISDSAMLCLSSIDFMDVEKLYKISSRIFDDTTSALESRVRLELTPKKED